MRELKNFYPVFSKRLIDVMKARNLNNVQLAEKLGTSKGVISNYRHGYFKPKDERMIELANVLGVAPEWLDGYEVPMEKREDSNVAPVAGPMRTINIYAYISCGNGEFNDGEIIDTITLPANMFKASREYYGMYAKGDSMVGVGIHDGDLLLFERTDVPENNKVGAFCIDNEYAYCKKYTSSNGKILLLSANDNYPPIVIEPADGCFRCVGILRKIMKDF